MVTESAMLGAVGAIYDAGLDPALWPAALEQMAEMLGSTAGTVGFMDTSARIAYRTQVRADEQVVAGYLDHYRLIDPMMNAVWARPPRQAFSDEMIQPKRELWRTQLYNEWIRPNDMEHSIQGFAFRDGERNGFLVLARAPHLEQFSRAEVELVTALLPHIARAFHVQRRLQAAEVGRESTADALDRVPQAVMLVDAQARVLHANRAAARLLQGAGGLDAGPLGLRAGCPEQTRALRVLVARASGPGLGRLGGSMVLDQSGDRRGRLVAHVVPCRGAEVAWAGTIRPAAIVIVAEPRHRGAGHAERTLRALFGLTAAEAGAACLVAEGTGVQAAAAALGVEPSTVRTHLVRAYAKTGTRRQAELSELVGQLAGAVSTGLGP